SRSAPLLHHLRPRCPPELSGRPPDTRPPLPIEEPHDELRHECLGRERATGPRLSEVFEVPALRHQAVETARVPEDRLDGIVGQIVQGEEASLLAVLSLACNGAVSS